jgi:hypothetical protein
VKFARDHKNLVRAIAVLLIIVVAAGVLFLVLRGDSTISYQQLQQDVIVNADLWSSKPEILSAGYGFDSIIGVDGDEKEVRDAGGTWNNVTCANGQEPPRSALTSSATKNNVAFAFGNSVDHKDGLPVVFSWPILPSTLSYTDFLVTLNTGETLTPEAASIFPNFEYNERHVAVLFADFGNRLLPGESGTRYVTRVEIVKDATPLMLVGPNGPVSAVGLFKESTDTPYRSGPYLVGAKLNRLSTEGEGAPRIFSSNLPNDGKTLYGDDANYRLRIFTSGGFSPDGVRGVLPTEFERFFRLHAKSSEGQTVMITKTGVDYQVNGGNIRVLGLAELGLAKSVDAQGKPIAAYDDCYVEDHDNYIDIVLNGDEAAVRRIAFVEIPAQDGYSPFYNPGGPGNNPTPGTRYTAPGPSDLEPVIIALDDPMTVTYQK